MDQPLVVQLSCLTSVVLEKIYTFGLMNVGEIFKKILPAAETFSEGLYTFDIGQNDLTAGLFLNMSTDEVKAFVPDAIDQFKIIVKVCS